MHDIAASVLDRINIKAKESGRSNQLCLQLFCQEEFLRRLEKSRYSGNLVLKGGLFLYQLTGFESRMTNDIDFLLRNVSNTTESLRSMLEEIASTNTGNDFLTYNLIKTRDITKESEYPGIAATLEGCIKKTRTRFCVDFGIGDAIIPFPVKRKMLTQLEGFDAPEVLTYSLESTIAEKLDAILDRMEYSSRMKDYHDLCWIPSRFRFQGDILTHALEATFRNRRRSFDPESLYRMLKFDESESMNHQWDAYARRIGLENIGFSEIIRMIRLFIAQPFLAAISGSEFTLIWKPETMKWEEPSLRREP